MNSFAEWLKTCPNYQTEAEDMPTISVIDNLDLRFIHNVSIDKCVYNRRTAEDVARAFRSVDAETPGHRNTVTHYKAKLSKVTDR